MFFCSCGDSPRFDQWLFLNERTWWNNWTYCSNECWMKGGEGWVCWVEWTNVRQHCSLTAVQRKTAFVCKSHDWHFCINATVFVPIAQAPPKAGAKELLYSQSTIQIWCWVYILVFDEGDFCRFAKESLPTEIGKVSRCTSVFFCGCTSSQDSPKASPMAIFKWKNLMEQLNLLLKWMLNEGWRRLSMLS